MMKLALYEKVNWKYDRNFEVTSCKANLFQGTPE